MALPDITMLAVKRSDHRQQVQTAVPNGCLRKDHFLDIHSTASLILTSQLPAQFFFYMLYCIAALSTCHISLLAHAYSACNNTFCAAAAVLFSALVGCQLQLWPLSCSMCHSRRGCPAAPWSAATGQQLQLWPQLTCVPTGFQLRDA